MVVTVTCNPAIDRNVSVDRLVFEDRAYILSTRETAGGRGINASSVIHSFGGKTLAVAICGGKAGKTLESFLNACGHEFELVRIRQEIRTNMNITDQQGLTIKLNEMGPRLSGGEVGRLEKTICERIKESCGLLLCGSLPPGVPADLYARLSQAARGIGVPVLVDADGEALERALEAEPDVVTPNQHEAERLLSRVLITRSHFVEAVERIRHMGARSVVLSLGARGAMAADSDGAIYEVVPPRVEALCPIGAGDALCAAYAWARMQNTDFADAVRWGVAAGTASARLPGISFASLDETRQVYHRVEVRRVQ